MFKRVEKNLETLHINRTKVFELDNRKVISQFAIFVGIVTENV